MSSFNVSSWSESEIDELVQEITDNINGMMQLQILAMEDKIKALFIEAITERVYNYYTPKVYDRNESLKKPENIRIDYTKNAVLVTIDTSKLSYHSSVNEELDVSDKVWGWIAQGNHNNRFGEAIDGHDDGIGIREVGKNQWHRYEKRTYLELAKQLVEAELGLPVIIINDLGEEDVDMY